MGVRNRVGLFSTSFAAISQIRCKIEPRTSQLITDRKSLVLTGTKVDDLERPWTVKTHIVTDNQKVISYARNVRLISVWLTYEYNYKWWFEDVGQINEVALRWARLVLGWVTASKFNSRCGKFISVWPTTEVNSAWPSLPGRRNQYTGQRAVMLCCWWVKAGMDVFGGN